MNRSTLANTLIAFVALIGLAAATSCISQAKQAVAPEPDGTGTLACREIVEQCDSQCGDPFCIQRCSGQGNPDGAAQHQALVDCGQRNSCTDQDCMQANCPGEIQTCMGEPTTDGAPAGTVPDASAPGSTDPQPAPAPGT
jgi:hypothetical protein